jgi:hypothetical protein
MRPAWISRWAILCMASISLGVGSAFWLDLTMNM